MDHKLNHHQPFAHNNTTIKQLVTSPAPLKSKSGGQIGNLKLKRFEKQQFQFNDPLYEYLDNEVHNKEQHNFGPWI